MGFSIFSFFLFLTPLFEAWLYFLVAVTLKENRTSLNVSFLKAIRSYVGFFGHFKMNVFFTTIVIFGIVILSIIMLIQALFAYMRPVYVHIGNFWESIKEGFLVATNNYSNTVIISFLILIIGYIFYLPSLIRIFKSIGIQYSLWEYLNAAFASLIIYTLSACAFTHFYLSYRKWI